MAKPHITRTFGQIHFEDLDPHRFEDLVRELIYDYKDWQSIEATGRSGSDDGFDIRAFEKVSNYYLETDEEDEEKNEKPHPMDGNLWMIQCKRENEIGPQKVANIINEGVSSENPPYGYILVASANFSKKSYDVFREELKKKGVMEFYLWGKAELEDMLHMPKYDRILFTFFGISLSSKRRSRSVEIKSFVATKNKLFRILGEGHSQHQILIRDINDLNYPYDKSYGNIKRRSRWQIYDFKGYHVHGLWMELGRYYGYFDKQNKEWDYTTYVDMNKMYEEREKEEEVAQQMKNNKLVREYWELFPKKKQSEISYWGLLDYDDILVIDEKGDVLNKLMHIHLEFKYENSPFSRTIHVTGEGYDQIVLESEEYKRVQIFPDVIPEYRPGKNYKEKKAFVDQKTFKLFRENKELKALYDLDGKFDFLKQRDIIQLKNSQDEKESMLIKITNKYSIRLAEHLEEYNQYRREVIKSQVGENIEEDNMINVLEFTWTYGTE